MVTSKKYEFTGETIQWFRLTLKRIRRVADGKLGGFLESEQNLSQNGSCWVDYDAKVFGSAQVSGEARVSGSARICNKDKISKPHHVRYVSNLRWPLTSVPGGIRVGCEFHTYNHWKQHHVDIGVKHGLTAEDAKAYFSIMRAVRKQQRIAAKEAR